MQFIIQFSSVAQSCPTLCNPMNCSTPGLPVHHQLPEFTQTHAHRISDAIQPSHPVVPFSSYPQSLPASDSFPMSQLFAWGGQSMKWLSFFKKVILNYLLDNSHISVPLGSVIKGLLWSFDQVMFPWLFAYLEIVHCYFGTWRSCNLRIPY